MANIGELVVKIKANTSDFAAGLDKSKTSLMAFAAIAIGTFYKLGHAVSDSIDKLSELSDEANRLGSSVPALQKLNYVAEQNGVSTEAMSKGLRKLNVILGQAQGGSEHAAEAFTKLGLDASKLANMSLDQRYIAIADAIKKLPTPTEQAAAAVSFFGKSGVEQLVALKSNVKETSDHFVKLGGVISTDAAGGVEHLGDKIADMGIVWTGFINNLTVSLAGPLTNVIDWVLRFKESLVTLRPLLDLLGDITGVNALIWAFGSLGNTVDQVIIKIEQMLRLALAAPKLMAAIGGGIKETVGLGESTTAQNLFNADEALASDIRKRKLDIANGAAGITPTAVKPQKVDVTVKAGNGLIVDVVESDEMGKKTVGMMREYLAKEAQMYGDR